MSACVLSFDRSPLPELGDLRTVARRNFYVLFYPSEWDIFQ